MTDARTSRPVERWAGIAILFLSLIGLASFEGAWGLAVAALMWAVGYGLLEHARRRAGSP